MVRYLPTFLVALLICSDSVRAQEMPPLENRVGKTITIVTQNMPVEKAVITQVWKLPDGSPVMQARSTASGLQITLVENVHAKSAADRITPYRWSKDGMAPNGCPMPPSKSPAAVMPAQPVMPASAVIPASAKEDKVPVTDGGLLPALPKKEVAKQEEIKTAPVVVTPSATALPQAKRTAPPMLTSIPSAPLQAAPAPAPVAKPTPASPPAPVASAPAQRELVDGCEVITVNENGKTRKYKVVGTARDKDGMMTQRCQALDTGETITLSCGKVCAPAPACAPVAACPPVRCEIVKPACPPAPCKPVCEPVKKCEPAKVACAPAPCKETCKETCAKEKKHHKCDVCCDAPGGCTTCKPKHVHHEHVACEHESLESLSCKMDKHCHEHCTMSVPVPGVRLGSINGMPAGAPPQPDVPAFCTINSSSIRHYMCQPMCLHLGCVEHPFSIALNCQIQDGIMMAHGMEGEAVKNTLYLLNVLNTSKEWENRAWAAKRLEKAEMPMVKAYVEDALLTAAQSDQMAMVRVAAIHSVAHLNPGRQDVRDMLAQAAMDSDPRIKEAAGEAMAKNNTIQQAGYKK